MMFGSPLSFQLRSEFRRYLSLVGFKTYADLRAESARTYAGVLWWIVEPVISMVVYYVVFSVILSRGGPGYVAFLFAGLIPWRWCQVSVLHGSNAILTERGLMQQVYLPKLVFPIVAFLTDTVKFLFVFILLLVFFVIAGFPIGVAHLSLIALLLVQAVLVASLTIVAASVVPFVPDARIALQQVMRLWFFLSGVFYDVNTFPEPMRSYLKLNPMAVILDGYRTVLIGGTWPSAAPLAVIGACSFLMLVFGVMVIMRFDYRYPKMRF